jgi:hypothetical protein
MEVEIIKSLSVRSLCCRQPNPLSQHGVVVHGDSFRRCGAPELRRSHVVCASYASDIWDLGVVIAEILSGSGECLDDGITACHLEETSLLLQDVRALGKVAGAPERYRADIADCLQKTLKVYTTDRFTVDAG